MALDPRSLLAHEDKRETPHETGSNASRERRAAPGVGVMLTVAEFAVHARLSADATTNPPEPLLGLLTGILDACKAVIEDYGGRRHAASCPGR